MAEITAALVKQLRDKTGAGMMDAKKALIENNGDIEASADWLREKGILKAAKKADRIAAENNGAGRAWTARPTVSPPAVSASAASSSRCSSASPGTCPGRARPTR